MAEAMSKAEIVKTETNGTSKPTQALTVVKPSEDYTLNIVDVGQGGKPETFSVQLASNTEWKTWPLMMKAAILKKNTFKQQSIAEIVFTILYAERLGLDVIAGDVYSVDGRINTTNGAKIKYAMSSGKIEGVECVIEPILEHQDKGGVYAKFKRTIRNSEIEMEDLRATVTVKVRGWEKPYIYTAKLSEWFQGTNPNWVNRPEHMLRLNSTSHALNFICPMGSAESDEAPPVEAPLPSYDEAKAK